MSDETNQPDQNAPAMPAPQAAPPADTSTTANLPARPAGQVPVLSQPNTSNLPVKTGATAQQPSAPPSAPTTPQRSWYDRIVDRMASGSDKPRTVTKLDPTTGQPVTTEVPPASRISLTGHILAGAIASMMEGYAAGAAVPADKYGNRSAGNAVAMGTAFKAERQQQEAYRNAPQKQADEQTLRQYAATKNGLDEFRNQLAIQKLHEDDWAGKEDFYTKSKDLYQPVIDSFLKTEEDTGEQLVATGDRNLSHEAVMSRGDLVKQGLQPVQDGWETRTAPNGQQYHVGTYSLAKVGNVNANKAVLIELAKTNPAFAKLFDDDGNLKTTSGDSAPMNSTTLIKAEKQAHAANITYEFLHRMQVGLGVDEDKQLSQNDFNKKFSDDPELQRQAIDSVTALSNLHTQTTEHALAQLQASGKAGKLFDLLGKSPDEVGAFLNDEELKHVTAKTAAVNAGKPLTKAEALTIVASPTEPTARKAAAQDLLNATAKQEGAEAQSKQDVKDKATKAIQDKTDADLVAAAQNVITGDYSRIGDIVSFRGNQRTKFFDILHDAAVRAGKNPNDFSSAALTAKSKVIDDFASGKSADNLVAFNTFLGHANDALDTTGKMRAKLNAGMPSPLLNRPLNWIEKNAANDPDYIAFITSLEPVRKEFMTFLNQNRAEHDTDLKIMDRVLDDNATPAQIEAGLKQLGNSAAIRLNALGRKYSNSIGSAYPNLINPEGVQALQRMGIKIPQGLTSEGKQPAQQQASQPAQPSKPVPAPDGTIVNTGNGQMIKQGGQWTPYQQGK